MTNRDESMDVIILKVARALQEGLTRAEAGFETKDGYGKVTGYWMNPGVFRLDVMFAEPKGG